MTAAGVALRVAQIDEHWEARRREISETAESNLESQAIVDAADLWHCDGMNRLYEESGWTMDEIGAWTSKYVAGKLERAEADPDRPPL